MASDSHSKFYRPMLIGFAGRKNSGKGTACAFYEKNYQYIECAFADPLKAGLAKMFDLPIEYFTDRILKEGTLRNFGFSPRQLMQAVGTEGVRALNPEAWLVLMNSFLQKNLAERHCIGDLRMENEAEFVRKRGGLVVHIIRSSSDLEDEKDQHTTEQGIDAGIDDLVLYNTGTLKEFHRKLEKLATYLGW